MSDKELVSLKKGETDFSLDYNSEEKELRLSFGYDGKGVDAGVYVDVSAEYFLDKLAEVIPGELDDHVINLVKAAL